MTDTDSKDELDNPASTAARELLEYTGVSAFVIDKTESSQELSVLTARAC